jgi:hypothetical protein
MRLGGEPDESDGDPVSSSIVTNTTALVLLDQHNTDDRQRPVNRQVGGVGGDNQTKRRHASQRGDDGRRHRR